MEKQDVIMLLKTMTVQLKNMSDEEFEKTKKEKGLYEKLYDTLKYLYDYSDSDIKVIMGDSIPIKQENEADKSYSSAKQKCRCGSTNIYLFYNDGNRSVPYCYDCWNIDR